MIKQNETLSRAIEEFIEDLKAIEGSFFESIDRLKSYDQLSELETRSIETILNSMDYYSHRSPNYLDCILELIAILTYELKFDPFHDMDILLWMFKSSKKLIDAYNLYNGDKLIRVDKRDETFQEAVEIYRQLVEIN